MSRSFSTAVPARRWKARLVLEHLEPRQLLTATSSLDPSGILEPPATDPSLTATDPQWESTPVDSWTDPTVPDAALVDPAHATGDTPADLTADPGVTAPQ